MGRYWKVVNTKTAYLDPLNMTLKIIYKTYASFVPLMAILPEAL